jgi:hypothetical protein
MIVFLNFINVHYRPKNNGIREEGCDGIALATMGTLKNNGFYMVIIM